MRAAPRDHARAPGLPPTGQTCLTPRDSILPPTYLLVRLDQRFAIDPYPPSPCHLAMQRVTWLEPRTPHQPGKLQKLSKNEFVFTPFIFRVNKKGAFVSAEKSIECTLSTGGCRVFGAAKYLAQLVSVSNPPLAVIFSHGRFAGKSTAELFNCENRSKNLTGGGVRINHKVFLCVVCGFLCDLCGKGSS